MQRAAGESQNPCCIIPQLNEARMTRHLSSVSAGPRRLVPQGSGAISTKGVLQVGKDAFQIGNAVHDAWDAGKDAWHQIKGRSVFSIFYDA